jgi:hypothetical protein
MMKAGELLAEFWVLRNLGFPSWDLPHRVILLSLTQQNNPSTCAYLSMGSEITLDHKDSLMGRLI